MTAWGLGEAVIHDVGVIVSELVTNAVLHGGGDRVDLHLSRSPLELRIEVTDPGIWPDRPTSGAPPGPAESGRGLALVAAIAQQAGIRRTINGTCAWAVVAVPDQEACGPPEPSAPADHHG
jgi:anti-sigma regulatory factor (Ser/Thr protein kinase)